jgi:hypothetical protein
MLTILTIPLTVYWQFLFLETILAASVDVSTYNKIYFCELFLAAHFSRKSEKPSDKVPTVHFLLCDDIVHFATYLLSKIVLYSIYVIMYVHGNQLTQTTDHRPRTTDHRRHTLNLSYYLICCLSTKMTMGVH